MRLVYSSAALRQLDDMAAYIASDDPTAARSVLGRILRTADLLGEFPMIGRQGSVTGTREWVVPGLPYVIVYQVASDEDAIVVLNVFHGAQDRP